MPFVAAFPIRDRVYGSSFFIGTGFHGLHVLIGTFFLLIGLIRIAKNHFSTMRHHLGLELAIWYWHFVDLELDIFHNWINVVVTS